MNVSRVMLPALAAAAALAVAGCGGGSDSVPSGSIAVVDGTEIPKSDLDALIAQAKKGYEASKQEFPKAGTPQYQAIQTQYVAFLVQREELRKAAADLGIGVTPKDITKAEDELVKSRYQGKRASYEKALEEQGYTKEDVRRILETSVLQQKIFDDVTKDVEVSDDDVLAYHTQNQSQYGTPESRDVRHILIAVKDANGQVDFGKSKAEAEKVYAELKAGADFAALAKQKSADPGSKDVGGKLTISRGQTVPEFDKTAFELAKGELSKPVKTQYGYHVIEAVSPIRPAKTTSFDKVKASIRAQLLQQKRNEIMTKWIDDLGKKYKSKVSYASGYEPPEVPEAPTQTQ